ncbi:MAG: beta-galactosidase [Bacillota bacterium]
MPHERIQMHRGVLRIDGAPTFQLTADYPYYRDQPEQWPLKLQRLQELGIETISFYTPWRHHEVDGRLDFTGETAPNRDVVGFIRLLHQMGLRAILKPGPFIHAEVDFGGLPDRLDSRQNPQVEAMRDAAGQLRLWHRPLPAPYGYYFRQEVEAWFAAVRQRLIEPFAWPHGPIIALQALNEGIYSDANRPFTAYDYAPSALAFFGGWQVDQGRTTIAGPPRMAPTLSADRTALQRYLDWGLALGDYLGGAFRWAGGLLEKTGLPVLSNLHPPEGDRLGTDWWLAKVVPESWGPVHYGFTNWIGCVSHDPSAFYRYLVLVKRQPGPNLEENWSFSQIYDSRYRFTVIPYFQTLLCLAAGATGFNVYTGAGTDGWDEGLDSHHSRPYPDTAPVGADGSLHPKARTLQLLTAYLNRWGAEWLACESERPLSWGIYPAYSALAGWGVEDPAWEAAGVHPPVAGVALNGFMRAMRAENRDFGLVNITAPLDPAEHPAITLVGGFFMDAETQRRLLEYVRAGGTLILARELPRFDADLTTPCSLLVDGLAQPGAGRFRLVEGNPFAEPPEPGAAAAFQAALQELGLTGGLRADGRLTQAWVRRHPESGVEHLVILSLADQPGEHHLRWGDRSVAVTLPGRSGALLRLEGGRLSAALVKGANDCDGQYAVPVVRCAGETVQAPGVGDWLYIRGEEGLFQPWQ